MAAPSPPKKPKQPHEYQAGPLSVIRQGFWAFHQKGPFEPPERYKTGSPVWNLYRKGYIWAKLNPNDIPDWAYSNHRAIRKALELGIKWSLGITKNIEQQPAGAPNSEVSLKNLETLRKRWQQCLEEEVWIHWSDPAKSERVTTTPGKKVRRKRGQGRTRHLGNSASKSPPNTTSRKT